MKTICFFILFVTFIQCSSPEKGRPYQFNQISHITFQDMQYPEILGITMQLVQQDSLMLINDFHGDSLIKVFNLKTQTVEKSLIAKGEGPDELLSPLDIYIADSNLYVLSRPLFRLNHISLKEIVSSEKAIRICKDYQMPPKSDCFIPLNGSQFVFSGMWDKRYALLDIRQNQIKTFGEYPDYWEEEKEIPEEAKAMFHQSMFMKNEQSHLFASCSGYVLEIYQYDPETSHVPTLIFQKQLGKYSYDYRTGDMIVAKRRPDSDPCVTTVASSSKYIYLVTQSKENRKHRDILVIDWKGNPVKQYKSDKRISCLSVDETAQKAYCIIEDPEDKFVSFDL